jgi:SAM-dependent methyltransferase
MNRQTIADHACRICGAAALEEMLDFAALSRVTSDSKPFPAGGRLTVCSACGAMQKLADSVWLDEISRIYGEFEIYHQSGGAEQPIYDLAGNGGTPRSAKLVEYLARTLALADRGHVLDFGCGNGAALATFAASRPEWTLFGSELSDRALPTLRRLPGFAQLFTCPPKEIAAKFALITLIHSLEHLVTPVATLADLRGCLEQEGHLFVQVPDCRRTPYDLLVADHLLHFTLDTLRLAGERAGYRTVALSDSVVNKELSWIGCLDALAKPPAASRAVAYAAATMARQHVAWLQQQADTARNLAMHSACFGIFGTSISGTWLYGILGERVAFFVDEDPGRIDRRHMGLPILAPTAIPAGADVFVPLIPEVAAAVKRRLASPTVRFHTPPPLPVVAAGNDAVAS